MSAIGTKRTSPSALHMSAFGVRADITCWQRRYARMLRHEVLRIGVLRRAFFGAVIGKEDADGLIKPKAFIVLKNGYTADEGLFDNLKAHVKERAGPWKYPRWIDVRPELPRTATGKFSGSSCVTRIEQSAEARRSTRTALRLPTRGR